MTPLKSVLKLSMALGVLTAMGLVPFSPDLVCTSAAWAQSIRNYGQAGQAGVNGREGRPGREGGDRTLSADGSSIRLDLAGTDGEDGEHGSDARPSFCGRQPRDVDHNLRAPDGGNGGSGGAAGDGGNGGALLVYYANLADLRQVFVNAAAGRGGRGGLGGNGSVGCRCDRRSWELETCTGTQGTDSYRCTSSRYTCTDGRNGSRGSNGQDGKEGQMGLVSLVNQREPLAPETPTLTAGLSQLLGQRVALSKNLWTVQRGATGLLAPGSVVNDEYRLYVGRAEGTVQLAWEAERSPTQFANERATVSIDDNRQIQVGFSEGLWADGSLTVDDQQHAVYRITRALREEEATQFDAGRVTGNGRDLQLVVLDRADVSDIVDTRFEVSIRTADGRGDRRLNFRSRYEGELPANLVEQDRNRFVLNLGQLPISPRDLAAGNAAEIRITAVRSLGNNTAETRIDWRGELRR